PAATYIFSDIERLSPPQVEEAARLRAALARAAPEIRFLSHPIRSWRRFELLRRLHAAGINAFTTSRLTDAPAAMRFPVFVRGASDHLGACTPLLHNAHELEAAREALIAEHRCLDDLIVVEYLDVADPNGVYHKYSAFCVGGAIVPEALDFGRNWVTKGETFEVDDPAYVAAERRYIEENPHAAMLAPLFAMAGIDYGRIDYALVGGRPQVFEINTNPMIEPLHRIPPPWRPAMETVLARYAEALLALDAASPPARYVSLGNWATGRPRPRPSVRAALHAGMRRARLLRYENRIFGRLRRLRGG